MEIALKVDRLSFHYGSRQALNGLSFSIRPGQFLGLLGPNGAGKSTLVALLTRLLVSPEGNIEFFGKSLKSYPAQALARLGVVFQQSTLDLELSVQQNLLYHGALHGLSRCQLHRRIDAELERFGLRERQRDQVRDLNGGHRRRLELARALIHQPSLLLLDEPTAGLDIESRNTLNEHVRALCREQKIAVLWTSHLIEEIRKQDDILIINRGQQLAWGACEEQLQRHCVDDISSLFRQMTAEKL